MRNRIIIISVIVVLLILAGFLLNKKPSEANNGDSQALIKTSVSSLLSEARDYANTGDLLKAREVYLSFFNNFPNDPNIAQAQKELENLNIEILFSPVVTKNSFLYVVQPGDTLSKIAKMHNTTVALIKRSNGLKSDIIRPADELKITNHVFNVLVDKSQNVLTLRDDDGVVKNYLVSTGKDNCTPVGTFKIINKLVEPVWFKAGAIVPAESPENILGSRWMGFDIAGYGIHGTTLPESIGKQETKGCVRMLNQEVEELFDILPVGTEVTIVD